MPTMPTPFIGGAESPRREAAARDELAPPFVPESAEAVTEAIPTAESETGSERKPDEQAEEIIHVEIVEEDAEPSATEPMLAETREAAIAESEAVEAERASWEETEIEEAAVEERLSPQLEELIPEEMPAPELLAETAALSVASETVSEEPEVGELQPLSPEPAAGADGLPDWLLGADGAEALDRPGPEQTPATPMDKLVETARELERGELGERVRALIAQLGPYAAEIAIPRAFAAGYLAAEEPEEK